MLSETNINSRKGTSDVSINQSINKSIKSFINASKIFSLQANWGHNGEVNKVKVQLELLKN